MAAATMARPPLTYKLVQTLPTRHRYDITAVSYAPNGRVLVMGSADSTARIWCMAPPPPPPPGSDDPAPYTESAYSTSTDSPIDATPAHILAGYHTRGLNDVAWSKDSRLLCTASDDSKLAIWDAETGSALRELIGHTGPVLAVAFSPQNHIIASGGYDEKVCVWDYRSNTVVKTISAHAEPVTAVDFSHDGHRLVSGSYDGVVNVYDNNLWERSVTLLKDANVPVSHVQFSPNGKVVLAAYIDSKVRLWSSTEGKHLREYVGHRSTRWGLDSSFLVRYGLSRLNYVIAGSECGSICIWPLNEREIAQRIVLPAATTYSSFDASTTAPTPVPLCTAVHNSSPYLVCAPTHSKQHLLVYYDEVPEAVPS